MYILIQTGVCHILHSFLACKIPLLLCQDFFLLLLKICIKLIRITFLHKVLGNVQIISRYLTVQWWAQAGIFWEEMNWKISKNVLNWPYIVISTKYLLFCYYHSLYLEKEYVTIYLLLGPPHLLWDVSFGFWVTWSISSWQENYKGVFFPKLQFLNNELQL